MLVEITNCKTPDTGTHPKSGSDISGRWTVEEQSEGFALKNFVHLPPSEEEVVKQTQPHEQGCGLNIRATKNPGMSREREGSSVEGLHVVVCTK